jgi:hypothetical protein
MIVSEFKFEMLPFSVLKPMLICKCARIPSAECFRIFYNYPIHFCTDAISGPDFGEVSFEFVTDSILITFWSYPDGHFWSSCNK